MSRWDNHERESPRCGPTTVHFAPSLFCVRQTLGVGRRGVASGAVRIPLRRSNKGRCLPTASSSIRGRADDQLSPDATGDTMVVYAYQRMVVQTPFQ